MLKALLNILLGSKGPRSRSSVSSETEEKIRRDWDTINTLLKQGSPSQLKQALITADKSLDNALRDRVAGETMGERLKNAVNIYDRDIYNKIWQAHKLRNSVVHESGFEPAHFMITDAVDNLKKGLLVLGVRI
jgi:hypothetical protein